MKTFFISIAIIFGSPLFSQKKMANNTASVSPNKKAVLALPDLEIMKDAQPLVNILVNPGFPNSVKVLYEYNIKNLTNVPSKATQINAVLKYNGTHIQSRNVELQPISKENPVTRTTQFIFYDVPDSFYGQIVKLQLIVNYQNTIKEVSKNNNYTDEAERRMPTK